jgi:hypothetical protein
LVSDDFGGTLLVLPLIEFDRTRRDTLAPTHVIIAYPALLASAGGFFVCGGLR